MGVVRIYMKVVPRPFNDLVPPPSPPSLIWLTHCLLFVILHVEFGYFQRVLGLVIRLMTIFLKLQNFLNFFSVWIFYMKFKKNRFWEKFAFEQSWDRFFYLEKLWMVILRLKPSPPPLSKLGTSPFYMFLSKYLANRLWA